MGGVIRKDRLLAAPVAAVWQKWSTEGGLNSFLGLSSRVEMVKGGPYEIYFRPDDDELSTKGAKLLAFVPQRMLAFEWRGGPYSQSMNALPLPTWCVVILIPISGTETKLEFYHLGFREGGDFAKGFESFSNLWEETLQSLEESLAK
jgi:uncharacterized protein YndB with AHSA1/START domain